MNEKLQIIENIGLKTEESKKLLWELQCHYALEELGIDRTEIVGIRKAKILGTNVFSRKTCQIKLRDGTEHFVPYELIYFNE